MEIGFVGTGTIAGAMAAGLSGLPDPPRIVVSPRSEAVSAELSRTYRNVRRAGSSAEVVASAGIVVLGMRPAQLEAALAGLQFRAGQIVVSLVAGLSLKEVQRLAPASRVVRCVPMPGIRSRIGPITLFPAMPEMVDLLSPLGDLFLAPDETLLNMGGLNAFMSSYFELQEALIRAGERAGAPPDDARKYVVSLLGMLSETARHTPPQDFHRLVPDHQTPGGLNEGVRAELLEQGWFDVPAAILAEAAGRSWRKLG